MWKPFCSVCKQMLTWDRCPLPSRRLSLPVSGWPGGAHRVLATACLFALPALAPAQAPPARSPAAIQWEDGGWVRHTTGQLASFSQHLLRVEVTGAVELRPSNSPTASLRYEWTAQARSAYQVQAAQQLATAQMVTESSAESLSLGLSAGARNLRTSRLRLYVPLHFKVVKVRQMGGSVLAVGLPAQVHAQIYAGDGRFEDLQDGLVVFSGGGTLTARRVRGDVEISSGGGRATISDIKGSVRCELTGGDIEVRDVSGLVDVSTGGGNVSVERAGGMVTAATEGGLLEVKSAVGPVVARNREGFLRVASAGDVKAYAPTGPIQVANVHGMLTLASSGGNIYAELGEKGISHGSRITSQSGNITLSLPARLNLTIEAESQCACSSPVISDFPAVGNPSGYYPVLTRIPINGGGAALRVATQEGRVVVKKAR